MWFDVDKDGLRKILEQKGIEFALFELVQNSWDAGADTVDIMISPVAGRAMADVTVCDDSPDGFKNLSHAWTLFAESDKKKDPTKRGRFNLGEKLVLALCEKAAISSTTGTVFFDADGRTQSKAKTEVGTIFRATMRMTRDQMALVSDAMRTLIPPANIQTTFNGTPLLPRKEQAQTEVTLPTVIANEDGVLTKSQRKTLVTIHTTLPGEKAMIYEMGIPVVETGDLFHVNVHQKVPVNLDRDNVPPSYLRLIRAHTLNVMAARLEPEEAKARWVTDALSHPQISDKAVTNVIEHRYGQNRVIYDPSDAEGTKIAVSKGYTVIAPGSFDAEAWENIRRSRAALPAGQVTPSPKPFSPDGEPLKVVDRDQWTPEMKAYETWVQNIAHSVTDVSHIRVTFANDPDWGFNGCIGREGSGHHLTVNISSRHLKLSDKLDMLRFTIHELAHIKVSDHLSNDFHEECCKLGAKIVLLALSDPDRVWRS